MADPPKGLSRPDFRKGKKLQITWEISAHASLRSATRMQQEPQKITANNPLMSGFPALPSTAVVRRTTAAQIAPKIRLGVANQLSTTFSYATVLRRSNGSQVTQNETTYMPREVAEGMQCNARRIMMTAAPVVVEKLQALPEELMDKMLPEAVPDRIDLANPETVLVPGRLPSFMPSVIRLSNSMRQLKYIQAVLRNSVLEVTGLRDLNMLKTWLESIDFMSLPHNLRNGFDAVRALSFSDINRSASLVSNQTWPVPSTWANDLELIQKCKDLHYVKVDVSLSDRFFGVIEHAYSMEEAMRVMEALKEEGEDDLQTYQLTRFLELKGLKVLRLRFFTEGWNMTTLDGEKMHMITSWLEKEFTAREQSTEVKFFGWFE